MTSPEQAQIVSDHRMRLDLISSNRRRPWGQEQYSGRKVAQMVIEALGV